MPRKTYETVFRGKFMFTDCRSFDDLIRVAKEHITEWEAMKADKVRLCAEGAEDDYFFIRTSNEKLAAKYELDEEN